MKKSILVIALLVILLAVFFILGQSNNGFLKNSEKAEKFKKPIIRVALVADSHNENDLLEKALLQGQGMGINFVLGLGDYTNLGTNEELVKAKNTFNKSGLEYYLTAGDRDGWDSRDKGTNNFFEIIGKSSQVIDRENALFVLLDNSNIYTGVSQADWEMLEQQLRSDDNKLKFVFLHKTPFHPQSSHIMGEQSEEVEKQALDLMRLLEANRVDGIFSGDLHFFARFNSPSGSVKITTIGAVAEDRNFQGSRFAIMTVFEDYSWDVEDVEIR